ncbi:MAG TPA: hypothetical protein VGN18_15505 [Jatrophihabitans sp.]|uniref:hypothetical protein n=1 Tax=Jatrophihabitans sp. TaxID=1932789 RepID=UPI002DFC6406|nr:hypothetical protein [Jatrophihabitans sp.]
MTSLGEDSPIGLAGRITTATRGADGPGEVELRIRGGTETFIARSAEPLDKGQPVIVVQTLGPRTVIVLPWADPVENLLEL